MNYEDTIDYLFSLLPVYQHQGVSAVKKDLSNIIRLCSALDNPQKNYKTIHVGGTNGKGTVSHMLSSVLQETGMKVGLYTSPHYIDFRERIKIGGVCIGENEVVEFVKRNMDLIDDLRPSFFELTVAMAFEYFRIVEVDVAVIEVGLGGRLDSTNIINPQLVVITNIGLDHQNFLGETMEEIAREKAGIIKESIPTVIGEHDPRSAKIFQEAALKQKTPITFASEIWKEKDTGDPKVLYLDNSETGVKYELNIRDKTPFTNKNMVTALEACCKLRYADLKTKVGRESITAGLENFVQNTNFEGRWQQLSIAPDIIADSGHNGHALVKTMAHLSNLAYTNLHFVLGFVKGKDIRGMLELFPKEAKYYLAKPDLPRGKDLVKVIKIATEIGLEYQTYISVNSAVRAAKRCAESSDLIFIGGSSYVVAEVLRDYSKRSKLSESLEL